MASMANVVMSPVLFFDEVVVVLLCFFCVCVCGIIDYESIPERYLVGQCAWFILLGFCSREREMN